MRRVIILCCCIFLFSGTYAQTPGLFLENFHSERKPVVDFQEDNQIVNLVRETVDNSQYSTYKLGGTHFDLERGKYILDCSGYVDHILEQASPNAYFSLVDSTGTDKPNSQNYYRFFTGLSKNFGSYWNKVEDVAQLRPGDILVFLYKKSRRAKGHVMVVMSKPVQAMGAFLVQVADSAPSRHSQDTRQPHVSGIGIGTLQLKVNPETGQPSAYAWKIGTHWKSNVNFAMARPQKLYSS